MRRVETIMGTTVSIDVRAPLVPPEVLDAVVDQLRDADARFSTYRAGSEINRLADGEIRLEDCSADMRHVLAACDHLATVTGGAFDARGHRPDGRIDPSGFVKGWAIEEAAWLIDSAGGRNYWINGGGDIVARGQAAPGRPWRVGIRHPDRADRVAAVLAISDRAVATSGVQSNLLPLALQPGRFGPDDGSRARSGAFGCCTTPPSRHRRKSGTSSTFSTKPQATGTRSSQASRCVSSGRSR